MQKLWPAGLARMRLKRCCLRSEFPCGPPGLLILGSSYGHTSLVGNFERVWECDAWLGCAEDFAHSACMTYFDCISYFSIAEPKTTKSDSRTVRAPCGHRAGIVRVPCGHREETRAGTRAGSSLRNSFPIKTCKKHAEKHVFSRIQRMV